MEENAQKIEKEIQKLIKVRSKIFNEWARTVKQNERITDIHGSNSPKLEAKAVKLLKEHDNIRSKILTLIKRVDSMS